MPSSSRTIRAALVVGLAGVLLGFGAPASAHNVVISTTPAEGSTITEPPELFQITTNDTLMDLGDGVGAHAIRILDANDLYYDLGCVTITGPSIQSTAELGEPGPYRMLWQTVSADGHAISGIVSFTWAPAVPSEVLGSPTPLDCGDALPVAEPEPEPTPTVTESTAPTTPAEEPGPSDAPPVLAIVAGLVGVAALGALVAVLVRKARSVEK